jgi:hypothetical protein
VESLEGRDNANFICAGKGIARVPVPVRSGRCSPFSSMSRIKVRYWCSSCAGLLGAVGFVVGGALCFAVSLGGSGVTTGSSALGGILTMDWRSVYVFECCGVTLE